MEIKDSHFLITGANRGIGRAVAFMAAKEGAHLYLLNRTTSERVRLERELMDVGAKSVRTIEADLSQKSQLDSIWKQLSSVPIDILFNNAGQLVGGMLEDQTEDEIENLIQVNFTALILLSKKFLPGMLARSRGLIINHSSVSAAMPFPGASTYAATKAGALAFSRCLQNELKGTGVATLSLITGSVDTRMLNEIPEKFGNFLDTKNLTGISADRYAIQIRDAILEDRRELRPSGLSGAFFWLSHFFPGLYRWAVALYFNRPKLNNEGKR